MQQNVIIVGGGLCGASAAEALREGGFTGRITLIGDELDPAYERPSLSKEYLQGHHTADDLLIKPVSWYSDRSIETRLGTRVARVLDQDRKVELVGGELLPFDHLLIATGGRPRRLPGETSERVLYLRTREDADRIKPHLAPGRHLVVIGAGFIGAEVAASARRLGVEVTVLEALDVPLGRVLGEEIGKVYAAIHQDEGVDLRTGEAVLSIRETQSGHPVVHTASGAAIECDAVLVGIGMVPNVEIAEGTGIKIDNGIVVDEFCRTTVDGIFAAGDVARQYHPLFDRHIRAEHYDNAIRQGRTAAEAMLGNGRPLDDPHWFWSDQYDYNLQYIGSSDGWDQIVVRGSFDERKFTAFYLNQGVVRAALAVNRPKDILRAKKMIRTGARVDVADLQNEDVDLKAVLRKGA
ncbi:FAD-dependent oxidoreductase [Streptomyces thermocarboxydovorans]|uniref:FAD-dependent oxidoreductase n=1 Tax=Streptomyces thermocarboxydovorans TaxID=59298 RepID=A0ABN1HVM9_9ACTN